MTLFKLLIILFTWRTYNLAYLPFHHVVIDTDISEETVKKLRSQRQKDTQLTQFLNGPGEIP